jgi:hypothetical protein
LTTNTQSRPLLFQPVVVFAISLTAAICFGFYLVRGAIVGSNSFQFPPSFFYVVPIIVPFVAFLLDRLERIHNLRIFQLSVDTVVIVLSMTRLFTDVVPVSGHTLFLTYAIFSSRSPVVVVTASLVTLQVIYLKYFVWHDALTSTAGIIFGALASYLVRYHFGTASRPGPISSVRGEE